MGGRRRNRPILILVGATLIGTPAGAQIRGTATVGGGVTDNARGTAAGGGSADALLLARLAVDGMLETRSAQHTVSLVGSATGYGSESAASTILGSARVSSTVTPSAPATLRLTAGATYTFASDPSTPTRLGADGAPSPTLGSLLLGRTRYLLLDGGEGVTWSFTPRWSLAHAAEASYYRPLTTGSNAATTKVVQASLGPRLTLARDVFGLQVEVGCAWRDAVENTTTGAVTPANRLGPYTEGRIDWRRELTASWTGHAGAGAVAYPSGDSTTVSPSAVAGLAWASVASAAQLELAHTVRPQVYLGGIALIDSATLSGDVRFGRSETFRLAVMGMLASGRLIGAATSTDSRYEAALGQVAAGWLPWPARAVDLSLVYTYAEQRGRAGADQTTQTVRRNTLLLTLTAALPNARL